MRKAASLAILFLLAGCVKGPTAPPTPTGPSVDVSGDAEARFDILYADLRELNGSLAIRIQVRNYADGLPLVEARVTTDSGTFFARLLEDPQRPSAPRVRAEAGTFVGDKHHDSEPACWIPSFPTNPKSEGPWWIFLEVLHNRTGLEDGGTVTRLAILARDENGTLRDEAVLTLAFHVEGGPNPYASSEPTCPLTRERNNLQ